MKGGIQVSEKRSKCKWQKTIVLFLNKIITSQHKDVAIYVRVTGFPL